MEITDYRQCVKLFAIFLIIFSYQSFRRIITKCFRLVVWREHLITNEFFLWSKGIPFFLLKEFTDKTSYIHENINHDYHTYLSAALYHVNLFLIFEKAESMPKHSIYNHLVFKRKKFFRGNKLERPWQILSCRLTKSGLESGLTHPVSVEYVMPFKFTHSVYILFKYF